MIVNFLDKIPGIVAKGKTGKPEE